jgi:hypothetical protein
MAIPFLHRLGWIPVRKGRGVLLVAGPDDDLAAVAAALRARFPRLNLFSTADTAADTLTLAGLPATPASARRLLARAKAHAVIVGAGAGARSTQALLAAARRAGIPCALVAGSDAREADSPSDDDFCIRVLPDPPRDDAATRFIDAAAPDAMARLVEQLAPDLARAHREAKRRTPLARVARWILADGPFAAPFQRKFEAIPDLPSLRRRLGEPATILCLGNGPSSEDAAVRETTFDALFRVNHSWQSRTVLPYADCVFTGLRGSVAAVGPASTFVFQTDADEDEMRYRCATLRGPIRFATAERLGAYRPDATGVFRPTNGAIMIAVAVALAPARLVISGIDLFSHAAGTYPGDRSTPNAYTIAHSRDDELAFMLGVLDRYEGELVILNEILRDAWVRHRTRRPGNEGHEHTKDCGPVTEDRA